MSTTKWIGLGIVLILFVSLTVYELAVYKNGQILWEREGNRQNTYLQGSGGIEYSTYDNKTATGSDVQQMVERFDLKGDLSLYFNFRGTTGCYAFNGISCENINYSSGAVSSGTSTTLKKNQIYETSSPFFIAPQQSYHTSLVRKSGKVIGILVTL